MESHAFTVAAEARALMLECIADAKAGDAKALELLRGTIVLMTKTMSRAGVIAMATMLFIGIENTIDDCSRASQGPEPGASG